MLQNRAGYWPLMAALAEALPTLTSPPTHEDRRHGQGSNLSPNLNSDLEQAQLVAEIKPQAKACG